MSGREELLREAMRTTATTQSDLARMSAVHQPSISQILSGRLTPSDDMLDRLLSCMGFRLEVTRTLASPELTRSERRSWLLHRRIASHLTASSLESWRPRIDRNLDRLRSGVTGQPHVRNLDRWAAMIERADARELHRVLTGLDRDAVEMREVSPMGGLLSQDERAAVLGLVG